MSHFLSLTLRPTTSFSFFFFNDTATTEIYTLSLHDALPISRRLRAGPPRVHHGWRRLRDGAAEIGKHTSELQSRLHLVCRLLLEKKKKKNTNTARRTKYSSTTRW